MPRKATVIVVPGIPPSLNDWMNWHHFARSQGKRQWKEKVMLVCLQDRAKPIAPPVKVTLTYFFDSHRRRDYDNYSGKFILDGLVPRVLPDDSSEVIRSLLIRFDHDPKEPRVEVMIERVA